MTNHDGYLADFFDDDGLKTVLVIQESGSKLQVIEQFGKQRSIKVGQVLCRYPSGALRSELSLVIPALQARLAQLSSSIDCELLWSQIETHEKDLELEDITSLWFGRVGAEELSACFRALLADNLHFKRNGLSFQARTPAQVEALLVNREREHKKRERKTLIQLWLDKLEHGQLPDNSESAEDSPAETSAQARQFQAEFEKALLEFLVERKQSDVGKVFLSRHPENPYEAAFEVLDRLGLLPPGSNPVSLIAGINPEFSKAALDEAATLSLREPLADNTRLDMTYLPAFSIDDETTREIDDALTIEDLGEKIRLGIHIADLTSLIEVQNVLDREAQNRTLTIYLPEETYTMFPERIGTDLASLAQGQSRPALSLLADFDKGNKTLLAAEFALTVVRTAWRLSYEQADAIIDTDQAHPLTTAIQTAHEIAQALRQTRLDNKAFQISRPELRVRVAGDEIFLTLNRGTSSAQLLVQEMMILYNSRAGQQAHDTSLPVIYRVQAPPEGRDFPRGKEIDYQPHTAALLFKRIKPARLSLEPGAHSGLGVSYYIQASSPIRRYADLVMQRQLASSLLERSPAYEQGELYRILAAAEETSREISAIERRSIRFWALEYLKRREKTERYSAIAIQPVGGRTLVELEDYALRGLLESGGIRPQPGEKLHVSIETVEAKRDLLTFRRA